jgi:hypothetical protein
MRYFTIIILLLVCYGCNDKLPENENITVKLPPGPGPWQLWTYEEKPVEYPQVIYRNGEVYKNAKSVYVDRFGQIVFKNEEPLKTHTGEEVYWSQTGVFITNYGNKIPRSRLFNVDGKPVSNTTPFILKESLLAAQAEVVAR